MKRNLLKSVIISVILLMGVSNVLGGNNIAFQSGAFFYFDPYYSTTQTVDEGYIQLAARKYQNSGQDDYGWYTAVTTLTKIANTRLYYTSTFVGPAWTDAGLAFHGWAIISNSTAKGNGDTEYWTGDNSTWYSEFKNYGLNKNSTYLFVATSASNGQSIQPNGTGYLSDGYSALNSQQTIKSAVNGADANSKATISITSYKMTGNGQVTQQTATLGTGSNVSYITAARTATTTLTVGTIATGYQFDGWYTAATGGSQLSPSTTYTYYPTAATTVYARFSEKKHNVTVQYKCGDMTLKNNTTLNNVGEITTSNIYKDFITGFTFSHWTLGTGVKTSNNHSSESININTLSSGNYALTANYTENSFAIRGGVQFGNTWGDSRPMTKQNASERIVYCTIPINGINAGDAPTDEAFYFKAYDSNAKQWFGLQADGTYYYMRTTGEQSLNGANDAENIELRADIKGNYVFKVDYSDPNNTPKLTVTFPEGCFLSGTFNDWTDTHSLLEGPVTIPLTKGDHQFKVHRYDSDKANDYWCGNTGIMTRENSSEWTMHSEDPNNVNCTITADIPGDYTFTYDRSSGKMTVSYPEKRTVTLEGSSYGTFVVKCDNYQQTSSTSNRTLDVPAGATITITDIKPNNDGYDQTMVHDLGSGYKYFSDSTVVDGNKTYTYTVNCDVTITEDFRTKEAQTIYVKVPKDKASAYWKDLRIMGINGISQGRQYEVNTYAKPMTASAETNEYLLYSYTIPAGNHSFILYPKNDTKASRIFSYEILNNEGQKEIYENCWLINNTENNTEADGDWVSATVTLSKTDIGQYGVYVDGIYVYENNKDGNLTRITNIPYGTQLQVLEGEPGDNAYTGYVGIIENGKVKQKFTFDGNPEDNLVTIEGDVSFDDLFVTKPNQIIYIGIPEDDTFNSWRTCNKDGHSTHELDVFIWHHSPYDMTPKKQNLIHKSEIIEIGNTKYYKFCLPEGFHAFNFECKTAGGDNDPAHAGTEQQTRPLISTTNCFLLNGETNSSGQFLGEWMGSQVILDAFPHGYYGFTCNGQQYTSDYNIEQTIDIPFGAEIQLNDVSIESEYYGKYQRFTTDLVGVFNGGNIEGINNLNHTIYGEVNFAANSVINKPCTVYLHIPQDLVSQWNNESNNGKKNYIYAHQFEDMYNDGVGGKLVELKQVQFTQSTSAGEYWMGVIPANVAHSFYFERKTAADGSVVNQTISFRYACPFDENICYTIREKDEKWIGEWGPLPNCTVKLGWCPIGKYGVMYDGKAYYSTTSEPITSFEVPYGSELTFIEGKPVVNIYDGGIMVREPSTQRINDLTQPYRVTSDVLFDDNFVTKKEHVFYLGVPDNNLSAWNQAGAEYYIWTYDQAGWFDMLEETCRGTHMPEYDGDGYKYYKFTLQPGRNEFRFEHKIPTGSTGNNSNETLARTPYLTYQVPITNENCYKLNGSSYISNGYTYYQGNWETLPARVGDYRLLYAEKELIKEDWETVFHTVYSHPSDIIRKRADLNNAGEDIVSLHINTNQTGDRARLNPMVILQQYDGTSWVDIESHTVLPLKAEGNMAMLPGRKKAYGDLPFYSDGIDAIKNDTTFAYKGYPGSGVWNFIVKQDKDQNTPNMITTLLLDKENLKRYEGTYYIRTSNALGQWANYTYPDNHMTFSSYSLHHRNFSHYYCKWVDLKKHYANVKFTVANNYGRSISDELTADSYTTGDGVISENANIRWSWNIVDNKVSRAYIQGTWTTEELPKRINNLVAKYIANQNADATNVTLDDTGDWIYSKDISNVQVGSELVSLTAKYPSSALDPQVFAEDIKMLIGDIATNQNKYKVRILYDFKIDKTLVALVPNENQANIGIDVLIERIDQNPATQVQANAAVRNSDGATVYAMMTFNKDKLINDKLSDQRRFTYWISFPFDVNIDDVFGFSEYGKQWRIREYDGAARAQNGYDGTQTYWKYIDINKTKVLEANKGYILVLNAKLRDPNHSAYTNRDQVSLYFPSASKITGINDGLTQTTAVVDRKEGTAAKKDWNWNMIGVPSYANKNWTITQNDLYYFFEYNLDSDSYEVCWAGKEQVFNSMFSYMVQFAGTIDWENRLTKSDEFPEQLAAKKDASKQKTHVLCLNLQKNAQREDRTYIQLMDEKATADFDMNLDLTKMVNANANIYSLAGNHQLAANVLPMEATTVPLGVIIKTAGQYTFSMPDGTDGIVAELIDYQTNTRTNLALDNYTVTLPAGTNHTRFAISLQPDKTVTGIEDEHWTADGTQVRKFLIDGRLYMQKEGVLYDAQGREIVNN